MPGMGITQVKWKTIISRLQLSLKSLTKKLEHVAAVYDAMIFVDTLYYSFSKKKSLAVFIKKFYGTNDLMSLDSVLLRRYSATAINEINKNGFDHY